MNVDFKDQGVFYLQPLKEAGDSTCRQTTSPKEKRNVLRRLFDTTCLCFGNKDKERKIDKGEDPKPVVDVFVAYNPTFGCPAQRR